jgi:Flp pilus assembly protein CpaB
MRAAQVGGAARVSRPTWANLRTALGLLLFCAALLAGQRVLDDARGTVDVWTAARDIPPDQELTSADLVATPVHLPPELLDEYVVASTDLEGAMVMRPVMEGELLSSAAIAEGTLASAGRSMTIPVAPEHAVGGALRPGDRIDVFGTFDAGDARARTVLLVRGVSIIQVVEAGGLVVGEEAVVGVTVSVTPEEAARLAFAIRTAELDVVRVDGNPQAGSDVTVRAGDFP